MDASSIVDASCLFAALSTAAKARALRLSNQEPEPGYPRVQAIGGEWCALYSAGDTWHPCSHVELQRLFDIEAA